MSFDITDNNKKLLDQAFEKMLRGVGVPENSLGVNLTDGLIDELSTSKNLTLYVDGTTGNDSNDGLSSASAFKTIQACINRIPEVIKHRVAIYIAPGTYNEIVTIYKKYSKIIKPDGTSLACIFLIGSQKDSVITGLQSGTFDASFASATTSHTAICTGAGWAVDELRGKFVEITSGSRIGWRHPIVSNTSDTVTVGAIVDQGTESMLSANFKIVEPAVIIDSSFVTSGSNSIALNFHGETDGFTANSQFSNYDLFSTISSEGITVKDIAVRNGSTVGSPTFQSLSTPFTFLFCELTRTVTSFTGVAAIFGYYKASSTFTNCALILNVPGTTGTNLSCVRSSLSFHRSVIAAKTVGISLSSGSTLSSSNGFYIKMIGSPGSSAQTGISIFDSSWQPVNGFYIEGYDKNAINTLGGGIVVSGLIGISQLWIYVQSLTDYSKTGVITNFSNGIVMNAMGTNFYFARRLKIKGNKLAAQIYTGGTNSLLSLDTSETIISDNDEGIKLISGATGNTVWIHGATFTNNGGGTKDVSIDGGTTWLTLAALQALTDKQTSDVVKNVIKSD